MIAEWWNVVSILAGLFAWGLPILALKRKDNSPSLVLMLVFISLACCSLAVLGQLAWQSYLFGIYDYAAIDDTLASSLNLAILLFVVAVLLNLALLAKFNGLRFRQRFNQG